jgi:hypothetical protein
MSSKSVFLCRLSLPARVFLSASQSGEQFVGAVDQIWGHDDDDELW